MPFAFTTATVPLLAVGLGPLAAALPRARFALLAIGLALAGSWLGALRLEAIDRSPMSAEIGRAAVARVTVTGPARRTQFALRIPGRIDRFGDRDVREPVLLQLPVGRSPPQGSILELPVLVAEPRSGDGRLRRAHVAPASRRPRGPARARSRGRGSARRPRRSRRPAALCDRHRARVGRLRRTACRAARDRARGGRRARRRPAGRLPCIGALPPARRLGPERRARRGRRAPRRLAARHPADGGPGRRRSRPSARTCSPSAHSRRSCGPASRAGSRPSRGCVPASGIAGGSCSSARSCCSRGTRTTCSTRASSSRSSAVAAIFTLVPRLMSWLEGYPLPRAAAAVVAVSIACGVATAPILLFQFGSVPAYSVIANAMAAPVVAPLLGLGLLAAARPPDRPGRRCAARMARRLARRVSRALCQGGRLAAARAALGSARVAGDGGTGGRHRPRPEIEDARRGRRRGRARRDRVAGGARSGAAPADGAARDVSRRRPGRRDAHPGAARLAARRPGPTRGERGAAAPPFRHPRAVAARAHASAAGPRRWRSRRPQQHPRPCRARSRGSRHRFPRSARRSRRRRNAAFPSSRRGRGSSTRSGACACASSGPTVPAWPSEDPNLRATVCLVSYGEVDVLLGADAESPVLLPLRPTAGGDPQGLAPRLRGCAAARAAATDQAESGGDLGRRGQHVRPSDARRRSPHSRLRPGWPSTGPTATAPSRSSPTGAGSASPPRTRAGEPWPT